MRLPLSCRFSSVSLDQLFSVFLNPVRSRNLHSVYLPTKLKTAPVLPDEKCNTNCYYHCDSRIQRFDMANTARLCTRSRISYTHFQTLQPISLRSTLMLSSILPGLPSGRFPKGFHTKILRAFHVSPILVTSSPCPRPTDFSSQQQWMMCLNQCFSTFQCLRHTWNICFLRRTGIRREN
jgi:hypothetical protein